MTDLLPERIWVYAEKLGWRAEIAATDKKRRDNQSEYLRSDTAIPKAEADAMVAAIAGRSAQYVFCRCPVGECHSRDGTCQRRQRDNVLSITHADARAAFEQAVQEAVEAERGRLLPALNQARLALVGRVSAQSAIDMIDAAAIRARKETGE